MRIRFLVLFFILFPLFGLYAQFQVNIKVSNSIDTIAFLRASIFDDKNYIPKSNNNPAELQKTKTKNKIIFIKIKLPEII